MGSSSAKSYGDDLDVFGDGAVRIMSCQALVVRLANTGTVVLPAGVIPQRANLECGIMTERRGWRRRPCGPR